MLAELSDAFCWTLTSLSLGYLAPCTHVPCMKQLHCPVIPSPLPVPALLIHCHLTMDTGEEVNDLDA